MGFYLTRLKKYRLCVFDMFPALPLFHELCQGQSAQAVPDR